MNLVDFRKTVHPYTMTPIERIDCLHYLLDYVRTNNIQGDFVECGVWRGGNVLGMIKYLESYNITEPNVWLYDTFFGMTMPDDDDKDFLENQASDILENVLCMNSLEEVQTTINNNTNYPREKIKYVVGDVCKTLLNKDNVPNKIALLRLDTDWYASTKVELEVLWDKLEVGAPCIIDDFGHWQGCKKAVYEFLGKRMCDHDFFAADYTCVYTFKKC